MREKDIKKEQSIVIYTTPSGEVDLRVQAEKETIWATINQMAEVFGVQKAAISKHLKNIFETGELIEEATVSKMETVQKEGDRIVRRKLEYYNLDAIIAVGYRVNSKQATQFRIWATRILKKHIIDGYTINKKRIAHNYDKFIKAVESVKALSAGKSRIGTSDVLELVKIFSSTWLSLDAYDKGDFTKKFSKKKLKLEASELYDALADFKHALMKKGEATELFAQEKRRANLEGIVGNVMQSAFGREMYPSIEEKAAHLLYFIVKNHPFNDGNKRSGAFAFVWFLRRAGKLRASITPQALTALTLLVAESSPKEKDRVTALVANLLK